MKIKPLESLVAAARKAYKPAPAPDAEEAPLGFATRVASQAWTPRQTLRGPDLFERVGWCGAVASAAICLIVFTLHARQPRPNPFEVLIEAEPAQVEI